MQEENCGDFSMKGPLAGTVPLSVLSSRGAWRLEGG